MKAREVTVAELEKVVALVRKTWISGRPCGTLEVEHEDGKAVLRIRLRFPLSM